MLPERLLPAVFGTRFLWMFFIRQAARYLMQQMTKGFVMRTIAADWKKVPVSFKVGEGGKGEVFISVRDQNLMPNIYFSFSVREGVSFEDAQALVDHLNKCVVEMGYTMTASMDQNAAHN